MSAYTSPQLNPELKVSTTPKLDATRLHFRWAAGSDRKHTCAKCTKAFCTNRDLEKHGTKAKHCAFHCACNENFTKLSALRRHIAEFEAPDKYRCPLKKRWLADCNFASKRLGHLNAHLRSDGHGLDKKAANGLLKRCYPAASKGGRSKGKGKQAPQYVDAADSAATSIPIEKLARWARQVFDRTVREKHLDLAASSRSRSPESGDAPTGEESVAPIVEGLPAFGPATEENTAMNESNVAEVAATTTMAMPGFDFNTPISSPASHVDVDAGGAMRAAVPGFGPDMPLYPVSAAQMNFGGALGAAAPTGYGFTTAPNRPAAASGFHQAANHGNYMMPGHAASMMWFAPDMTHQLAYPGIHNPVAILPLPMMTAPVNNWPQTTGPFAPHLSYHGVASPFDANALGMDGSAFSTAAPTSSTFATDPFVEDNLFAPFTTSEATANLNVSNESFDTGLVNAHFEDLTFEDMEFDDPSFMSN